MPELERIGRAYAKHDVVVIGAASDGEPRADRVRQLLAERAVTYAIWLGANLGDQRSFGFDESIPGTVVIDRAGRISWRKRGAVTAAQLRAPIDAALAAD